VLASARRWPAAGRWSRAGLLGLPREPPTGAVSSFPRGQLTPGSESRGDSLWSEGPHLLRILLSVCGAFVLAWLALLVFLATARPGGLAARDALRLLPDILRLVGRLAADPTLPRSVRVRLALALAYLALPIDLVPDFIPIIGYADDAIVVCAVLRSVVRRAGREVIRRHWPGTSEGLAALWQVVGLSETA
jgi:uncharacterized membrane protein YkvA (DUF1232 family)